jgi:hypothetical protein
MGARLRRTVKDHSLRFDAPRWSHSYDLAEPSYGRSHIVHSKNLSSEAHKSPLDNGNWRLALCVDRMAYPLRRRIYFEASHSFALLVASSCHAGAIAAAVPLAMPERGLVER